MSATASLISPQDLEQRQDTPLTLISELHSQSTDADVIELNRRFGVIRRISKCIDELREVTSVRQLIELAPIMVCKLGFDRAMVSRVDESTWSVERSHSETGPEWAKPITATAWSMPQRVAPTMLEAEMIRRRVSLLVTDAQADPRVHRGLATASGSTSYVAAPIMPEGKVIGFLHADRFAQGVDVDEFDREVLSLFAEQFGRVLERAVLLERFEGLRRTVDNLTQSLGGMVSGCVRNAVEMPSGDSATTEPNLPPYPLMPVPTAAQHPDCILTKREIDVLQLMAAGYTNSRVARGLVISEGTVKSHVKHILRKLGASNRAEAVSRWLQRDTAS